MTINKLFLTGLFVILAGCGGGQDSVAKADRRDALHAQIFPDPADRQGLFLVFPIESGGVYSSAITTWFSNEVSRAEVADRMLRFCKRQSRRFTRLGVRKDNGAGSRTLHTGETKAVYTVTYSCLT